MFVVAALVLLLCVVAAELMTLHVNVDYCCCLGYGVVSCLGVLFVVVWCCCSLLFFVVGCCCVLLSLIGCRWCCSFVCRCVSLFVVVLVLIVCSFVLPRVVVCCRLLIDVGLWMVVFGCLWLFVNCVLLFNVCCKLLRRVAYLLYNVDVCCVLLLALLSVV